MPWNSAKYIVISIGNESFGGGICSKFQDFFTRITRKVGGGGGGGRGGRGAILNCSIISLHIIQLWKVAQRRVEGRSFSFFSRIVFFRQDNETDHPGDSKDSNEFRVKLNLRCFPSIREKKIMLTRFLLTKS